MIDLKALTAAKVHLDGYREPHHGRDCVMCVCSEALLLAAAELERAERVCEAVGRIAADMEHAISVVERHRSVQLQGGQQVGTGGALASTPPSGLSAIARYARDINDALTHPQAEGKEKV